MSVITPDRKLNISSLSQELSIQKIRRDPPAVFTRATRSIARYMLRQRGWLAGYLSDTRRYCIKTAKPILKLFRPSGSPIELSSDPCADTQFQGEPLQRGR